MPDLKYPPFKYAKLDIFLMSLFAPMWNLIMIGVGSKGISCPIQREKSNKDKYMGKETSYLLRINDQLGINLKGCLFTSLSDL